MVLTIPQAGLHMELPASNSPSPYPTQAFAITLSDSVIEGLIDCVQNGQDIKLCLGNSPTFLYGSSSHRIQRTDDSSPYDLFLTDPKEDSKTATKLPGPAMSLFKKPDPNKMPWLRAKMKAAADAKAAADTPTAKKTPAPAAAAPKKTGLDANVEALKDAFAQHEADKPQARFIEGMPPKSGAVKLDKKLGPTAKGARGTPSSLPPSPALTGLGSASPLLDKAKKARSPIIHELAFRDQSYDNLWNKYPGSDEKEFKVALEKVADLDKESQNYILRPKFWKELDVFNHEYASDEERQVAIDNAVKAYDRQRISPGDVVWQLLLPEHERNKGKILSKLVKLAQGPAMTAAGAPSIKLSKADESGPESGGSNAGEPMSRSSSQTKKQPTAREKQEKRLLGNKKAGTPKVSTPKVSPTKPAPRPAATERSGAAKPAANSKFKSAEFITNSDTDSSDSSAPLIKSTTVKKPAPKPAAERESKPVATKPAPKEVPAQKPKPRPAMRKEEPIRREEPVRKEEVIKAQITAKAIPRKRPHVEDDSSSSSGAPLIKRHKPKESLALVSKPASSALKRRPDEISSSRDNRTASNSSQEYRPQKSTSPTKSSPLASSPPTNASDLDPAEENAHISVASKKGVNGMKRKLGRDSSDAREAKRARLSSAVMKQAMTFQRFYDKYKALHKEMALLSHPPEDQVMRLIEMRERLEEMKEEIYDAVG